MINRILDGSKWVGFQLFLTKAIGIIAQLITATLLMPEDFGVFATFQSISVVGAVIQQFGIQEVIIQRGKHASVWYNQGTTLSIFLSLLGSFIVLITSLLAKSTLEIVELPIMALIYSISLLFTAYGITAEIELKLKEKFKTISLVRVIESVVTPMLLVFLVWMKLGVYAFVVAPAICIPIRVFFLFRIARVPLPKLSFMKLNLLVGNSLWNFAYSLSTRMIFQVEILVCAILLSTRESGIIYLGLLLVTQVVVILSNVVFEVAFPVLSKSNQYDVRSFTLRLIQLLLYFGVPVLCLQGLYGNIVLYVLPYKWQEVDSLIFLLSIAMIARLFGNLWALPFKVSGDFRSLTFYGGISLIIYFVVLYTSTKMFGYSGLIYGSILANTLVSVLLIYLVFGLKETYFLLLYVIELLVSYITPIIVILFALKRTNISPLEAQLTGLALSIAYTYFYWIRIKKERILNLYKILNA